MNIENIKYIQYSLLFLTIICTFFAVFFKNNKNSLISFFLSSIFFILFTVFLFSGVFSAIFGSVLLFLFIIFYSYLKQEIFIKKEQIIEYNSGVILNITHLVIALIICAGIGYSFYNYTLEFFKNHKPVEVITLMDYKIVVNEFYNNYFIVIVLIIAALLISLIWFISTLSKESEDKCN